MSHVTYTEDRVLKKGLQFYISIMFLVLGSVISSLISFLYYPILITSALILFLIRDYNLLKAINVLKYKREYVIIPKRSIQNKNATRGLVTTTFLVFLPLLAILVTPVPYDLPIALAFVISWPLSNLIEFFFLLYVERKLRGMIFEVTRWFADESGNYYIKEYGYVIKN